jgi:hypothetical protein
VVSLSRRPSTKRNSMRRLLLLPLRPRAHPPPYLPPHRGPLLSVTPHPAPPLRPMPSYRRCLRRRPPINTTCLPTTCLPTTGPPTASMRRHSWPLASVSSVLSHAGRTDRHSPRTTDRHCHTSPRHRRHTPRMRHTGCPRQTRRPLRQTRRPLRLTESRLWHSLPRPDQPRMLTTTEEAAPVFPLPPRRTRARAKAPCASAACAAPPR